MPRVCTICSHAECDAINRLLAAGESANRRIATRYGVTEAAIRRHKADHIPVSMLVAQEAKAEAHAVDVMEELTRCFVRVNRLFDACDEWLRDADDPEKYDIGPRAGEVLVTYVLRDEEGKPNRRKATLQQLLDRLGESGFDVAWAETKYADPRDLVLKTADRLRQQTELLAKLLGQLKDNPTINVLLAPDWLKLRAAILRALETFPDARLALASAIAEVESDAVH